MYKCKFSGVLASAWCNLSFFIGEQIEKSNDKSMANIFCKYLKRMNGQFMRCIWLFEVVINLALGFILVVLTPWGPTFRLLETSRQLIDITMPLQHHVNPPRRAKGFNETKYYIFTCKYFTFRYINIVVDFILF